MSFLSNLYISLVNAWIWITELTRRMNLAEKNLLPKDPIEFSLFITFSIIALSYVLIKQFIKFYADIKEGIKELNSKRGIQKIREITRIIFLIFLWIILFFVLFYTAFVLFFIILSQLNLSLSLSFVILISFCICFRYILVKIKKDNLIF